MTAYKTTTLRSPLLTNLLIDQKKISQVLTKRRKTVIEKTVSAGRAELLEEKVAVEIKDGWRISKRRKKAKSCRLERDKPLDEQLEDELWCIAAKMGFDELSLDRNFTISIDDGLEPRQIDVFAKDRETAILIECTQAETPKKKNMSHLTEKIESIKGKVAYSINSHYGNEPKLKIRWVIATRNIEWSTADLKKAEFAKVIVLRDQEIDYYSKLSSHLKKGAKYQFLSHLFSQENISGLNIEVPATRGNMGGFKFYNFIIKPSDLLKVAYVGHKASRNIEDLGTYQRMLQPKRLANIAKYIDSGGSFPTNIVINVKAAGGLNFSLKEKVGEYAVGTLKLPNKYASAWVVDGQHRLYGYAHSKRAAKIDDKTTFPVLAYENLPSSNEARLFVDINYEQVRVPKNLLIELYSNLKWDSEDVNERNAAIRSRIILSLNQRKTSPICGYIKTAGAQKTKKSFLTLANLDAGLAENKLLGEIKASKFKPGPLYNSSSENPTDTLNKVVDVLAGYLSFFADALPSHWAATDKPQGYLCSNLGIRALLRVLSELLEHIELVNRIDLDMYDARAVLEYIKPYVEPIIAYFEKASSDNLKSFKGSSKAGVSRSAVLMMKFIHDKFNDFCPETLGQFLDSIDEEGTIHARNQIDEIQKKLFKVTIKLLKDKYGEEGKKWWYEGVPNAVRESCLKQQNADKGLKEAEQYLYLIDYHSIASNNWDLFKEFLSFSKDGGKTKQLEWLIKLNHIRQTTHHAEKWPATKDDVAFVNEYYSKIIERFTLPEN